MISEIPLVSVICFTYNHSKFIGETLNGFVNQKVNFLVKYIVHDDASTDKSQEIIEEYSSLYPKELCAICQVENQRSKGSGVVSSLVMPLATGKYIAFCEGDDYWIDNRKLQKQVDFLEANPRFSICFSPAKIVDKEGNELEISNESTPSVTTFKDLLKGNYLNTPTVMIRREALPDPLPEWIKKMPMGDWPLLLLASLNGDIKMFQEPMVAYRIHDNGIWSTNTSFQKLLVGFKSRRILLENLPAKAHPILLHSIVGNALYISSHYRENGQRLLGLKYFCFYLYYRLRKSFK
jgi:glycosyltransferase involved in cell wall biosynthesis